MTDMDLNVPAPVGYAPPCTRDQQRAAALVVATRCTDMDDCRELLDMLGLREELRR
jgi:hypothetical protein